MGIIPVLALAALLAGKGGNADNNPASTPGIDGLACLENLSTPEYPKAALQSHVDGSIWTWTTTDAQGGNERTETQVARVRRGKSADCLPL